MSFMDHWIVIAGLLGEVIVLALLIRQGIWRNFPLFVVYLVWSCLADILGLVALSKFPDMYKKYILDEVVLDSLFQFVVLVEVAWSVLRPLRKSLPRRTPAILALLIAVVGVLVWPLAAVTVSPFLDHQSHVVSQLQGTVGILRVGFFLLMASFSQIFAIGWRDRELQLATGFGFYSIVSLLAGMLHSHQYINDLYQYVEDAVQVSYVCSLFYWVVSFATKQQERKEFSPQMQQILVSMSGGARTSSMALRGLPSEKPRNKD